MQIAAEGFALCYKHAGEMDFVQRKLIFLICTL